MRRSSLDAKDSWNVLVRRWDRASRSVYVALKKQPCVANEACCKHLR